MLEHGGGGLLQAGGVANSVLQTVMGIIPMIDISVRGYPRRRLRSTTTFSTG